MKTVPWLCALVVGSVLTAGCQNARTDGPKASVTGQQDEEDQTNQPAKVTLMRVPGEGIQPQTAVDSKGIVHLIYYTGDASGGDIFYVRSEDGEHFSRPLRVNSRAGSAIAIGNVRGAHLAVGKTDRIHVAWFGSGKSEPRGPGTATPMLYTRLNDACTAFEPQRNVLQSAVGLDGGGSVAADGAGNVYVAWHAPEPNTKGEASRCVWVARSTDEGRTFTREERATTEPTGACGCCGMRAFADAQGTVYVLYRSATESIHRDMYLLASSNRGADYRCQKLDPWEVAGCPMSTAAFGASAGTVFAAWETDGQVSFTRIDPRTGVRTTLVAAPGAGKGRKHPVVAGNPSGETILAWTEGMGWNRGGSLAWQVFDKSGKPTADKGQARGVPVWSLVAVFARSDGGFTIIY